MVENEIKEEKKSAKLPKNYEKFIKKIRFTRKKVKKQLNSKEKKNTKRIVKCNKKILSRKEKGKDIYLKINEFNTNGKKTVVYFIDSYYPIIDGVVSVLDNYATYMSEYYNVVVCCPKHKNKTYVSDKYFVLGANSLYFKAQGYDYALPVFDATFNYYISLLKIDLIHINAPFNMGNFGLELAKRRNIPSITTFHSQFRQDFYKATNSELLSIILSGMIMNVYQNSTTTITMNEFAAGIMRSYGLKRKKIEIVPNATSLVYKDFDETLENSILNKHKIDKNKFNLIFIGRFVKVKNIDFILECINELRKTHKDFSMIFVGYGPEENTMKKYCAENGLVNNVIFTGKILNEDEKAIIIKNSNLLVFPSTYDTDGIIKIECACYSVPTICFENTGVSSGFVNNETAFITKNNKEEFVEKLRFILDNPDIAKQIGDNARKETYITWKDVGKKLKVIYDRLLNTKNLKNAKKNKNKTTKKTKI